MSATASLLLSLTLALSPAEADATASAAAAAPRYLKLASPGFTGIAVPENVASFFADHFSQQLTTHGIQVITATEISALIGLERQKQLMGCESETNCLTELGNALGVDGLVVGSVAKFGGTLQVNIKVLDATNGSPLAVVTSKAAGEEALIGELNVLAKKLAEALLEKTGRQAAGSAISISQETQKQGPQNILSVGPLGFAILFFNAEFERAVLPALSVYAGAEVFSYSFDVGFDPTAAPTDSRTMGGSGFGLSVGVRWFAAGNAPQGLFVAPEVQISSGSFDGLQQDGNPWLDASGIGVRLGAMVGYTGLLAWDRLALSGGLGLAYSPISVLPLQVIPLARFSVGYAF
ncbi:MAG: hypothetical protein M3Y59_14630 [Myxococcota bacterium]|nr:hypothetical protein [Myxococcota bacterium]